MHERYDFIKQLPSGGFGNVAVLFDRQLNREVVVKSLINPSRDNRQRFIHEATILFKLLPHEHVVDIIEANLSLANPCIILEYCKHGTLQDWVTNRGWFGPPEINVAYALQHAALGLHAIHELDGFHRDVKPANLFIGDNKNGQLTIKLGDFGFGRLPLPHVLGDLTRHAGGTIGYMAPELYVPNPVFTRACDIYSLGITGIELLTASREIDSLNSAWIFNSELKTLLLRMTRMKPAERPTALEVAQGITLVEKKQCDNAKKVVLGGLTIAGLALLLGGTDQ
ncbi:MAG TPA: serine/threonine-protein kinase [Pyrinomonadaceae bacterium]